MSETVSTPDQQQVGTPLPTTTAPQMPVVALGMSLAAFFAITYVVCVGFCLLFPNYAMYEAWFALLPGFTWLTWPSFFLGLIESYASGWYVAVIFGPLYNFFVTRFA